jgi:Holliday junction resolvase
MPIDPATVLKWLAAAGYPLEYDAARHLRGAGFIAEQGRHFVDPTEGKSREVDVVARAAITGETAMVLVVECKVSTDKPWVVLTTEEVRPAEWMAIASKRLAMGLHSPKWNDQLAAVIKLSRPIGVRVIEARQTSDKGRDGAHEAMEQVVSAAVGLVKEEKSSWFALPAIVVDGDLFRLSVPGLGMDKLQPVDWYRVRWHGAQAHTMPTAVDIVRASFVAEYAKEMRFLFGQAVEICDLAWKGAGPWVG